MPSRGPAHIHTRVAPIINFFTVTTSHSVSRIFILMLLLDCSGSKAFATTLENLKDKIFLKGVEFVTPQKIYHVFIN